MIDWTKPVEFIEKCRYQEVRLLCTDAPDPWPIRVMTHQGAVYWSDFYGKTPSGEITFRNKKIKKEGWINIYSYTPRYRNSSRGIGKTRELSTLIHPDIETALKCKANSNYITTIKIEWEE